MVGRLAFVFALVLVACAVLCCLVGVRMARIGFIYADIYLYTVAVGVDCGVFSCSCGGVVRLWLVCVYGYMQGLFRVGVVVYMYICIYIMRLWLVVVVVVCSYMDRYI